jgi:hypothetical protein
MTRPLASLVAAAAVCSAGGGTARAEPLVVGGFGQFQHLHGESAGGFGILTEVGLSRERWTYFGELGIGALMVSPDESTRGAFLRLDLGARRELRAWNADHLRWALYAEATAGGTHFWFATDQHATRPDVSIGWGWQLATTRGHRYGMRSGFRLVLSADDAAQVVPRPVDRSAVVHPPAARTTVLDGGMLGTMEVWW